MVMFSFDRMVRNGIGAGFAALLSFAAIGGTQAADPMVGGDVFKTSDGDLHIQPINHASFVMGWNGETIYIDPVGGAAAYDGLPRPNLIFITHAHGDHYDPMTLSGIADGSTKIVAPKAVYDMMPPELQAKTSTMANGDAETVMKVGVEAVPAYNVTPERLQYHPKGMYNGYVLTIGGKRIYISGDTEDIPEMRALKNIDIAFVCMNLPYTMDVEHAADAVVAFKPKVVYPYHYRGSDVDQFAKLVASKSSVEVRLRDWYAKK
jgi:L-ascorbate metabolism protein UlaG (beta-lactamase superfamily)